MGELQRRLQRVALRIRSGTRPGKLRVETGALIREVARRELGMAHYLVQLIGGFAMLDGFVAEMQTGEGKTLTALVPAVGYALAGRGCHVLTSNDYLAQRDADLMRPVYEALGLTVGHVVNSTAPEKRIQAYRCDITYSTAKETGFDFLRDCLEHGRQADQAFDPSLFVAQASSRLQRQHHFALVDEADAILIDEATTPLIIASPQPTDPATVQLYRWCHKIAKQLDPQEAYEFWPKKRIARLSEEGCRTTLLSQKPSSLAGFEMERIYQQVENSIVANLAFECDRDYMISEGKVVLVDESTGRVMDGRKMQDGMHQAIEAKEGLSITSGSSSAAQITSQSYFRLYTHLAGMTGTANGAKRELKKTFKLRVAKIPTNRPSQRKQLPNAVFGTLQEKQEAIVEAVQQLTQQDRPVLVGTPSIDASDDLSALFTKAAIPHQVLNAKHHALEADIVSRAGIEKSVTIATNMAGRGTDIKLTETSKKRGGLHVIVTEFHSSPRIDRQLVGRCGRQGDPGSVQTMVSLEDELFRVLSSEKGKRMRQLAASSAVFRMLLLRPFHFRRIQAALEKRGRRQRQQMLKREKSRLESHQRLGLDPFLEFIE